MPVLSSPIGFLYLLALISSEPVAIGPLVAPPLIAGDCRRATKMGSEISSKMVSKMGSKTSSKMDSKMVPKLVQMLSILVSIYGFLFYDALELLWRLLGALLGLMMASCAASGPQKQSKTEGFLRFLKMQLVCSFKLLMALLGSSCLPLRPSWL